MVEYRCSSIEWKPSPIVALANSADDSQVAVAREDGSIEVWLVSPGSVGWHCQLTIHGDCKSRISSLVWCRAGSKGLPSGRLFSSSIDGTVSEWDLFHLKQKIVLGSIGVSIWQMAVSPTRDSSIYSETKIGYIKNKHLNEKFENGDDHETSGSEDDSDLDCPQEQSVFADRRIAIACDDGSVRIFSISKDVFIFHRSLPRVSGRTLSVTWSPDASRIYSGSSDGFIRCWNAELGHETYRITVGLGGLGSGSEICVWSLLFLRCGTLVSGDSTGSVQFWDSKHGTLLQSHSNHKGDVNALAAAPSHNRVFSAGSDGQVILYKLSCETIGSSDGKPSLSEVIKKWVYVGYVRAHTHDIRALTVALPISREDTIPDEEFLDNKVKRSRKENRKMNPNNFTYHKWAHSGVPMLISAGDDSKLFAYSVREFNMFSPHDICPAPQRVPIQMVNNTIFNQSLLLVQSSSWLDILRVRITNDCGGRAKTDLLARVKSKASRKILCSAISTSGSHFGYSDQIRPNLFELKRNKSGVWSVNRIELPLNLPFAHSMIFNFDCSRLFIAGHDRRIYVVEVCSTKLVHTFTPRRDDCEDRIQPNEPPITKMFTSSDGQWLAATNCYGDVYVFNLETQRQHWFISRLDGASVLAGGFLPWNSNVLIISTSLNQVFAFDVEAKQLGERFLRNTYVLPKRFQEFPGEVMGLSFLPSSKSSTLTVYSARAKCVIDFGIPLDGDNVDDLANGSVSKKLQQTDQKQFSKVKNDTQKRGLEDYKREVQLNTIQNFDLSPSNHPVLFMGYLSKSSILIIDKPWIEVVKTFDTQPVHRHIYGT